MAVEVTAADMATAVMVMAAIHTEAMGTAIDRVMVMGMGMDIRAMVTRITGTAIHLTTTVMVAAGTMVTGTRAAGVGGAATGTPTVWALAGASVRQSAGSGSAT